MMSWKKTERTVAPSLLLLAVGMLLLVSGCGSNRPERVRVAGTVTIDGKPLTDGFIRLVPDSSRPSGGKIGPDGRFTLGCFTGDDGCVRGTHKVEVHGSQCLSETSMRWLAPKKYTSAATSGLTVTIDEPTDSLQINLTWAGSPEAGPFTETLSEKPHGPRTPGIR